MTGLDQLSIGLFSDENPSLVNALGKETIVGHFPAGTSFRCACHFRQLMLSRKFCKYDFGKPENLLRYNQEEPPSYNLS